MFYREAYISPKYRPEDYFDLNLKVNSCELKWKEATNIFLDRIQGRHLYAIELLLDRTKDYPTTNVDYSFSVMGLMCFVIETLHQFYNGLDETERYQHREAFVDFLTKSM